MRKTLIGLATCLAIILCSSTFVSATNITFHGEENGEAWNRTMNGVHEQARTINVGDPTKEGYDFIGWETDDETVTIDNEAGTVKGVSPTPVQTPFGVFPGREPVAEANPIWEAIEYDITYELDGGEAEGNPDTYTIEDSFTLNNPTKEGYEFVGWLDEEEEDLGTEVSIEEGTTGNLTFIAVWEPVVYTIDYILDGGEVEGNPDTYTIEDSFTLNNPTKEGYTFVGWEDEEGNDLGTEASIEEGTTGDKTFTAKWEAIPEEVEEEEEEINNPATGDGIIAYMSVLFLGLAGFVLFKKLA